MVPASASGASPDHRGFRPRLSGPIAGAHVDGVHVFSPQGGLIGHIRLPARCANVCTGG